MLTKGLMQMMGLDQKELDGTLQKFGTLFADIAEIKANQALIKANQALILALLQPTEAITSLTLTDDGHTHFEGDTNHGK